MKRSISWITLIVSIGILIACKTQWEISSYNGPKPIYRIQPYLQQTGGDPQKGLEYLSYGNAVGNGIPSEVYRKFFGGQKDTVLNRTGENGYLPYYSTYFSAPNGSKVISGNCFVCHASRLNGKVILGLGNSLADFTEDNSRRFDLLAFYIKRKYGKDSPVWENYEEQHKWFKAVMPNIVMPKMGMNPAFRIEEASLRFRNPDDLTFKEQANYEMPGFPIGTDVPPLWNVKKKQTLYYNGGGRGDFTKLLMQVAVLGIHDSTEARDVQQNFVDVLAWLNSLEPPKYPGEIDRNLAAKGQQIFMNTCKKCHGSYGKNGHYPNKIVQIKEVKTDSLYAQYGMESKITDWYNNSWFGQSMDPAQLVPSYGYVAPPLDGVWATAPYLHNGSVPTLEALLNSKLRPKYWSRSFDSHDYNLEKVGWNYQVEENGNGKKTYDTTMPGSGNYGHYFGDEFSQEERIAVIEYLKTL